MTNHQVTGKTSFEGLSHRPRRHVHETLSSYYDRKAAKPHFCRSCLNDGILYDDLDHSMYCPCEAGDEREEVEQVAA